MHRSSFGVRIVVWPLVALGLSCSGALVACGEDDAPSSGDAGTGGEGTGGKGSGGKGSGGEDGGAPDPDAGYEELSVVFDAVVGDKPVDCTATYPGLGTSGAELAPVDFRFYVHDVRFLTSDGEATPAPLVADGKWQTGRVALLDFENKRGTCSNGTTEVRKEIVVKKPPGTFTGIAFRVGVPEDLNHANPVAGGSPLNLTALHWGWLVGYKYAKFDFKLVAGDGGMILPEAGMIMPDAGRPTSEGGAPEGGMIMPEGGMDHGGGGVVLLHLGSTGCNLTPVGEPGCSIKNRPDIHLAEFDPATQAIVLDYAKLIAAVDPIHDKGGAPGCMSEPGDPECASILDAFGLEPTGEPKDEQRAFKAVTQ